MKSLVFTWGAICGSDSVMTDSFDSRLAGWFRAIEVVVDPLCRPVFRVQGHQVLRRVACPRTSDDVSAFSGRPHGELRVSPLPI